MTIAVNVARRYLYFGSSLFTGSAVIYGSRERLRLEIAAVQQSLIVCGRASAYEINIMTALLRLSARARN